MLLHGVSIVLVPLLGLGSDQVSKANNQEQNVEAYHLDELRGQDFHTLCERLMIVPHQRITDQTIILYTSPQSLAKTSPWFPTIECLVRHGCISSFTGDEAHEIVRVGRPTGFRPVFQQALRDWLELLHKYNVKKSHCFQSATFTEDDQKELCSVLSHID